MAIKDLPKYVDIRSTIRRNGRYTKVGTAVKDTHVIHHSMTAQHLKGSNPNSFANTHIDSNGWQGIAYPFVIMPDGTIYQCDDLDRKTYHAGNTNTRSIGTCLVGDFRKEGANEKPTQEQIESLYLLNKELYKELPNMKYTIGHQECPGYSWKNCPGDTWDYRKVIDGTAIQKVTTQEKKKNDLIPGAIGTVFINYPKDYGINACDKPNGTYKKKVQGGLTYTVYDVKDGWYDLGNSTWVSNEYAQFKRYLVEIDYPVGYGVNVADKPNGNFKGRVEGGLAYYIYDEKDGWYDLGQSTWINGEYVKLVK